VIEIKKIEIEMSQTRKCKSKAGKASAVSIVVLAADSFFASGFNGV
jgi:hypothetical protein